MPYDENLAERIRKALKGKEGLKEKKMFGGLCFMIRGNMCCGIHKDELIVRVGPARYEEALSRPHARPMDITGRPLKGFLFVARGGYKTGSDLRNWLHQAVDFVLSLPPK